MAKVVRRQRTTTEDLPPTWKVIARTSLVWLLVLAALVLLAAPTIYHWGIAAGALRCLP